MSVPRVLTPAVCDLSVLGVDVAFECADRAAHALLQAAFGGLRAVRWSGCAPARALTYEVFAARTAGGYVVRRNREAIGVALDDAELVWMLDGDLTVELQRRRRDLYFVHAAVLEWRGRAFMLAGKSGAGKSVTAWAMLHEGFGYLSDELAPLDVDDVAAHPYPRAVSFKNDTASPPVPLTSARTGRSIHVSTTELPTRVWRQPLPLAGVFFLREEPRAPLPSLRAITRGEIAARLYPHVLNALAHPAGGLDAASRIARRCRGFVVGAADLRATATLLKQAADDIA